MIPHTPAGSRKKLRPRPPLAQWMTALSVTVLIGLGCNAMPGLPASGGRGADGAAPVPGAPPAAPLAAPEAFDGDAVPQVARDIEEADVVKIVGDKLYALNRFKGLLVVDVADPDHPALVGNLDLRGRGVEMYVVGSQAYVLLSADFYFVNYGGLELDTPGAMVVAPDGPVPPRPDFDGSQVAVIDLTDPTDPKLDGKINLVGFANESRRVGDILYVIGSNFGPYFGGPGEPGTGEGFVASINVADPENIVAVERKNLRGDALNMHVSETAIFAASRDFDFDQSQTLTHIQIIDISDPAGAIMLRGAFPVPGSIRNRFYMDAFDGVFRIATESFGFGFRQVRLFTYDLADLDGVQPLGRTEIISDEALEAVRFDGPRGYVVTFLRVDPLFVLDLSDPANPAVAGQLEVPGFSTHIEPRGDRLIAVGIDDTDGRRPAVAYYDVSDPANPAQLGRVVLGPPGSFTSSDAVYDEKAFKIVDELGLIAIPFRHVEFGDVAVLEEPLGGPGMGAPASDEIVFDPPECMNGVQLVDFDDTDLVQRGWFENDGEVNRVGVLGERVFALSQVGLQTVDITDRDHPTMAGKADFFDAEEMARFNGCARSGPPNGPGGPGRPGLDPVLLEALRMILDACGAMGGGAALFLPMCLWLIRRCVTRRRRRR